MLKKYILIVAMFCLFSVVVYGEFASVKQGFSKVFKNVSKTDYRNFYETAIFSIKNKKMHMPNKWRGGRSAYIYGCNSKGQLKTYVNMSYSKKVLKADVKVTFDGPISKDEAVAYVKDVGYGILGDMEYFASVPTVKVLRKVNLREGPDSKAAKIGALKWGDIYKEVTRAGKWVQVQSLTEPIVEGWVYRSYVRRR